MRFYLTQFIDFIPANWEFWRRIEGDLGCGQVCKKEFVTGLSVGLMPQCDGAPCEDVVSDGHAQVTANEFGTATGHA